MMIMTSKAPVLFILDFFFLACVKFDINIFAFERCIYRASSLPKGGKKIDNDSFVKACIL